MSFTFVQAAQGSISGSGTTMSATLGSSATVGHVLFVPFVIYGSSSSAPTFTITDQKGNTYTPNYSSQILSNTSYKNFYVSTLIVPSGSNVALDVTITITSGNTYGNMGVAEFSFTGGIPTTDGTVAATTASTASPTTGTIAVAGSGPDLIIGLFETNATTGHNLSVGSGFSQIAQMNYAAGTTLGFLAEYAANVTSPEAATAVMSGSDFVCGGGCSFKLVESFTAAPTTIPASHAGNITVTLAGTYTSWTGSPFSISGVTGATLASQTVNSATSATLGITTGSGTGTLTISDGSTSTTITVASATLAISPPSGVPGVSETITAIGTNTLWASETPGSLFTLSSSVPNASISSIVVNSNTSATFSLVNGTVSGSDVIQDSSTTATATFIVGLYRGFISQVSGFPTGLAGSATVLAYLATGTAAPSSAAGAISGTVYESTATPGTYYCLVSYPVALLSGALPLVPWSIGGQTVDDFSAVPLQGASIYAPFKINQANTLPIYLVSSTDNKSPITGATVTAQVSHNSGASFSTTAGSVIESGNGAYTFLGYAADWNATCCLFRFTASGANTLVIGVNTTP